VRILLTGATGQVGGHLMWSLWRQGHEIWAVVRPDSLAGWPGFCARVQRLFGPASPELIAPRAISGHLWLSGLGVVSAWVKSQRGRIDAVVHAAADTRFRPSDESELQRTNVDGTLRVAALAEDLGAPHMIHLSTLFVAGQAEGVFAESDLCLGQRFRCAYERTKFEAEQRLRYWAAGRAMTLTTVRPGIVVGESERGASLDYPHFYGFLRSLRLFLDTAEPHESFSVPIEPSAMPPMVCVDEVSAAVAALLSARADAGRTLHLFDPLGPNMGVLWALHAGQAGGGRLRFAPGRPMTSPPGGRALAAWLQAHLPHLAEPGRFACEATREWLSRHGVAAPHLGDALMRRLEAAWMNDTQSQPARSAL
jgi:nucleoside-diphosphate-sugar epimerase